jgi:hypothetical protein
MRPKKPQIARIAPMKVGGDMRITLESKDPKAILKILRGCGLSERQIKDLLRRSRQASAKSAKSAARVPRSVKGAARGSKLVSDDA